MKHPKASPEPKPTRSLEKRGAAGYTLVEVVTAIAVVSIAASVSIGGLLKLNEGAVIARAATGAATVVQSQVDLILSESPFNPQANPPQIPAVLSAGTQTQTHVPIYKDPVTNLVSVEGTLTTTITDAGANVYQATVRLDYQIKGHKLSVVVNSLRASDL